MANGKLDLRIDTDLPGHLKTRRLIRALGASAAWSLLTLWCYAGKHRQSGVLEGMSSADIEDAAGWEGDPGALHKALVETGWIDEDGVTLHDWATHQPWLYGMEERCERSRVTGRIGGMKSAQIRQSKIHSNGTSKAPVEAPVEGDLKGAPTPPLRVGQPPIPIPIPIPGRTTDFVPLPLSESKAPPLADEENPVEDLDPPGEKSLRARVDRACEYVLAEWSDSAAWVSANFPGGRKWVRHHRIPDPVRARIRDRLRGTKPGEFAREFDLVLMALTAEPWWTSSTQGDWRPCLESLFVREHWDTRVSKGLELEAAQTPVPGPGPASEGGAS